MSSIAIIVASANQQKLGNKAVRAYLQQGWTVYPVNPKEAIIEGLPTYKAVREIPGAVDEASLYLAPLLVPAVLQEIKAKGIKKVWLNPGTESEDAVDLPRSLVWKPWWPVRLWAWVWIRTGCREGVIKGMKGK